MIFFMLVLGGLGYYAYARLLSKNSAPVVDAPVVESGTQGVKRRSRLPPPDFGLSERDKDRCANKFEMYIKIASAEAQTYGEERALERLDRKLEERLSAECLDYMYFTILKNGR